MSMARRTAAMEEELGDVLALEAYGAAGYSTHVFHWVEGATAVRDIDFATSA